MHASFWLWLLTSLCGMSGGLSACVSSCSCTWASQGFYNSLSVFPASGPFYKILSCWALPGLLVWLYPSGLTWIVASLNIVSLSQSLKAFFISFITVNNSILKCICPRTSSLPTFSSLLLLSLSPRLCLLFHSLWTGWFSGRWTGIQSTSVCVYQIVSQSSAGTCRVELTKQVVPRASLCEAEPHSELRST